MAVSFGITRNIVSKSRLLLSPNHKYSHWTTIKTAQSIISNIRLNALLYKSIDKSFCKLLPTLFTNCNSLLMDQQIRCNNTSVPDPPQLSNKDKLKRAVKEYGATVIIFHVSISLLSLGISYLAVTRCHHNLTNAIIQRKSKKEKNF
uniref:DUF1279 domain-containing protein n=2 Tax=Clastoptera arizonana TaxID=38151 RepID=A0A1B6DNT2_9HEMI